MNKLLGSVKREGITLIPLGNYFNKTGHCKKWSLSMPKAKISSTNAGDN